MDTIFIIGLAFITFATINTLFRVIDLWSYEKRMVQEGNPPLSNFQYYHIIITYLVGTTFITLGIIFRDFLYSSQSWYGIIITSILCMACYVLFGLVGSLVLSFVEARSARKRQEAEIAEWNRLKQEQNQN